MRRANLAVVARPQLHGVRTGNRTDRGSQYVSIRCTERLAEAGVEQSVGSKGDSYGNALAETIDGLVQGRTDSPPGALEKQGSRRASTLEWVSWFDHRRLLESIGYIPPAEAEANYYRQQASQTTAVAG